MRTKLFLYHWQGYSPEQGIQEGLIAANSLNEIHILLMKKQVTPYNIKRCQYLPHFRWHKKTLLHITEQLYVMLNAGIPLLHGIQLLTQQQSQQPWRFFLQELHSSLLQGLTLAQALEHFHHLLPTLYQQMIAIGELTGQLETCLKHFITYQTTLLNTEDKLKKSLRYPIFILISCFLITLLLIVFIMPKFSEIYANFDAPLPFITRCLLSLSQFILHKGIVIVVGFSTFILVLQRYTRTSLRWRSYYQQTLKTLPFFKVLFYFADLTALFRTLSITQYIGISLLTSLNHITKTIHSPTLRYLISQIMNDVQNGQLLSESIKQYPYFPVLCSQLIQIGEETGQLPELLTKLADIYQESFEKKLQNLSTFLEPLLMLVMALIIGGILIAIYLPIFNLANVVTV